MSRFLNFLYWAGMSVIGVTLFALLTIIIVGFWVHVVPEVWRAVIGG